MTPSYLTPSHLSTLSTSISPRDEAVLKTLAQIRLATGNHIARLHFAETPSSARQCRRVMQHLVERKLVAKLTRQIGGVRGGAEGHVFSLDVAGQKLLDLHGPAGGTRKRKPWTPGMMFLTHILQVSELYVLLREAERRGEGDVIDFISEPTCWRRFIGPGGARQTLKPDAYVKVGVGEFLYATFLEMDCGTESPATLLRKVSVYEHYWRSGTEQERYGVFPKVVFVVPDVRRLGVVRLVLEKATPRTRRLFVAVTQNESIHQLQGGSI